MIRVQYWRLLAVGVLVVLLVAACGQSGAGGATSGSSTKTAGGESATTAAGTAAPAAEPATVAPPAADVTAAAPATAAPAAEATTAGATAAPPSSGATGGDLLADVKQRGKLRIATDANYKPQSYKNPNGSWEGFDVDVGREIAKRLGVEADFMDISFDVITAGSWNGRWDINIGSMTITGERKKSLLFTSPYYYTPASFAVHKDSQAAAVDDLKGKKVGVGSATTYQDYLKGSLALEGEQILKPAPAQVDVKIYDTDQLALQDLALGNGTRLDAVLTALPTIQDAIKGGQPFKPLGDPVYYEDLAIALDQKSPMSSQSLRDEIDKIVQAMHQDGTLTKLSNKYYGIDLSKKK